MVAAMKAQSVIVMLDSFQPSGTCNAPTAAA